MFDDDELRMVKAIAAHNGLNVAGYLRQHVREVHRRLFPAKADMLRHFVASSASSHGKKSSGGTFARPRPTKKSE